VPLRRVGRDMEIVSTHRLRTLSRNCQETLSMPDHSQEFGTILGADANFKGELHFDSAAKVLGRFEGSIVSKG
jgi:cytoskeletal protein CcmA (bactofilin family)